MLRLLAKCLVYTLISYPKILEFFNATKKVLLAKFLKAMWRTYPHFEINPYNGKESQSAMLLPPI